MFLAFLNIEKKKENVLYHKVELALLSKNWLFVRVNLNNDYFQNICCFWIFEGYFWLQSNFLNSNDSSMKKIFSRRDPLISLGANNTATTEKEPIKVSVK